VPQTTTVQGWALGVEVVTWNCQHLANANKFGHIRRVNTMLGLFVPTLVTPLELLGEDHETES